MTISNDTRGRVKKIGEPIALFFGRLGLTPDGLTLIGFGITTVGAVEGVAVAGSPRRRPEPTAGTCAADGRRPRVL